MRIWLGLLLLMGASAVWAEPRLVRACDNDQDYPPFRWQRPNADGQLEVHGLGYNLLRHIFAKHGWRLELELLPIKRCLREVEHGQRFQLLVSGSYNAERAKRYRLTEPYDYVSFHAFYVRQRFPDAAPVSQKADLAKWRVCGIAGHNFAMFDLKPEQIDTGPENFAAAFQLLRAGRCDVFPYNFQTIEALSLIGQDVLGSGEFASAEITDVPHGQILMLISRNHRDSLALKNLIDSELKAMAASGELALLRQQFYREHQPKTP
ncbi:MAG: substrate-binding periplasmic protein [Pseudomonadota bacterium]